MADLVRESTITKIVNLIIKYLGYCSLIRSVTDSFRSKSVFLYDIRLPISL
jgi:hypothetical protein